MQSILRPLVRIELHVENDGANLDNAFARFVHTEDPTTTSS